MTLEKPLSDLSFKNNDWTKKLFQRPISPSLVKYIIVKSIRQKYQRIFSTLIDIYTIFIYLRN